MGENNTNIKTDKKKLTKNGKILIGVISAVVLAIIILVVYYVVQYSKGQKVYDDLNKYTANTGTEWYNMIDVDINELKKQNPDTRGWIFFENEDISYPIVQGSDDEKYLDVAFDGQNVRAGSIFLEALNDALFKDTNSIIYGHNMRDQSMFGKLQKYKNEDGYYKDHLYFQIITGDKKYRFQVFSFNDVPDTSDVYTLTFASNKEYADYLRNVISLSQVNIDVPNVAAEGTSADEALLANYKKLATLSTCTSRDDMRFVVIGTYVGEYDRNTKEVTYDSVR